MVMPGLSLSSELREGQNNIQPSTKTSAYSSEQGPDLVSISIARNTTQLIGQGTTHPGLDLAVSRVTPVQHAGAGAGANPQRCSVAPCPYRGSAKMSVG